jgi:hypothetical protein
MARRETVILSSDIINYIYKVHEFRVVCRTPSLKEWFAYSRRYNIGKDDNEQKREEEQQEILRLKAEKYDTWQWNYGSAPKFQLRCKDRWDGGILEIYLKVEHGKIAAIQIFGDFMALTSCEELEKALLGCSYQKEAISEALAPLSLKDCLGSITKEEFLQTILK